MNIIIAIMVLLVAVFSTNPALSMNPYLFTTVWVFGFFDMVITIAKKDPEKKVEGKKNEAGESM